MRFGLIGCGGIGQLRADALAQTGGQALVAVSDVDLGRAQGVASGHPGCAVVQDWRELIAREDVEAVIVSTPPSLHAEMCIQALEAGKHVLCEKPLARNPEECREILEAAEASGKFVATGFNYRFYPSILKAKEILDSGLIGELDHIRSYAGYTAADHNHEWLHEAEVMGGGALRDNGIHLIDLTGYFLGGVSEVKGFGSNWSWGFEGCEDNGFALMRSPAGKIATLQASWTEWLGYKFGLEIYGTKGMIRASCFPMITQVTWFENRGGKANKKTFYFPKVFFMEHLRSYRWVVVQSFILEFEAFVRAARGEQTSVATGFDGLVAVEVAQAATQQGAAARLASAPEMDVPPTPGSDNGTPGRDLRSAKPPESLSVVVVPMIGAEPLSHCLEALQSQIGLEDFEIIVPHDLRLGDPTGLRTRFPKVQFLSLEGRRTFAELRALGIRKSGGEIVAITEDHCLPNPDWCAQILKAHRKPSAAIGGTVEKETPDTPLDWSIYFADYLRYASPMAEGTTHSLTDLNVSYKRAALDEIAEVWSKEFHEPQVHGALESRGETLWLSPWITVRQKRQMSLGAALWDRYAFGRLFASTRLEGAPASLRLKYLGASVLIPALLMLRVAAHINRRRHLAIPFLRALPALLVVNTAWAWGEFLGYLTGKAEATLTAVQPAEARPQSSPKVIT